MIILDKQRTSWMNRKIESERATVDSTVVAGADGWWVLGDM